MIPVQEDANFVTQNGHTENADVRPISFGEPTPGLAEVARVTDVVRIDLMPVASRRRRC